MGSPPEKIRGILLDVLALIGGALLPLSLSPVDFWPCAFLSPVLLFAVTRQDSFRRCLLRFYLFNVGLFGVGASWVFVSINEHGNASVPLAGLLVILAVLGYALICLPQAAVFVRYCRSNSIWGAAAFSGLWVVQEWGRTWVLTGFPWLFAGYGAMGTSFDHIAPITGVLGLSFAVVLTGTSLFVAATRRSLTAALPAFLLIALSFPAGSLSFTAAERVLSVSLIQGNVDQHVKWFPQNRQPIYNLYRNASESEWGRDLIVWPEAALTLFRENAAVELHALDQRASAAGSALILGIPDRDDSGGFRNTVLVLGEGEGQYIKRRLVPFGEYVPLERYLRGLITFFNLPMSRNTSGPAEQAPLLARGNRLSLSICYEVVYPELVRSTVSSPDLLVTVSNDTWFGSSIGPWQHFQMARMRAMENGRSMLRATNNGVTAVVDHRGQVSASLPQFKAGILRQDVEIRSGQTPFNRWGSYPVLCLALGLILIGVFKRDQ